MNKFATVYATDSRFTIEDIKNAIDKIKKLPPIAIEMQVYKQGLDVITNNIPIIDGFRKEELLKYHSPFSGINIVLIEHDSDFVYNECKVVYNDGSHKIIKIFDRK